MGNLDTFLEHFEEAIEDVTPGSTNGATHYMELEVWDSLALLTTIAMLDAEYGVNLSATKLKALPSLKCLYEYVVAEVNK